MRVPTDQLFYLKDKAQLLSELERLGLALPIEMGSEVLGASFDAGFCRFPNRFCVRMFPGFDAERGGEPSALTQRRFARQAGGGAGFFITEPVAVDDTFRVHEGQLCLHEATWSVFASMMAEVRARSAPAPVWFLQLDDSGYPADEHLHWLERAVVVVKSAMEAGFDGVEIRCESPAAMAEIEAAILQERSGTRCFDEAGLQIVETVRAFKSAFPKLPLAVRMRVYTACRRQPAGFGTDAGQVGKSDLDFPKRLMNRLAQMGVGLLDMNVNHPALRGGANGGEAISPNGFPHEHPLVVIARQISIASSLRASGAVPVVMTGGFVWLRQFMPLVASGAVRDGLLDMVALDRFALAYPDTPADWLIRHRLDPERCCIQCGACGELQRSGWQTGCVLRQPDVYGPVYRNWIQKNRLLEEAGRCQRCLPAPCSRATPGALDIPGFMRTYSRGDVRRAGQLLRSQQPLPEMCSALAPYGDSGERDCIENILSGRAIPIRELQYEAACRTRLDPVSTLTLPLQASGYRVAVAGGGPCGLAAAALLLTHGHAVMLYESAGKPGGVPERLIPTARYPGAAAEIERLLGTAVEVGRLTVHLNTTLGEDISLEEVRQKTDALLLAVGLWKEKTLGAGDGVYSALEFLEAVKDGRYQSMPGRSVLLAGGDCAMDAACMLKSMGSDPLTVLFSGARSELHWCMEETWFTQPGIHARMLSKPCGYERDADGCLRAVRVQTMQSTAIGETCTATGPEWLLPADIVVEAMGLEVAGWLRELFTGQMLFDGGFLRLPDAFSYQTTFTGVFAAGALINGGASVPRCVEEGRQAALEIHHYLTR